MPESLEDLHSDDDFIVVDGQENLTPEEKEEPASSAGNEPEKEPEVVKPEDSTPSSDPADPVKDEEPFDPRFVDPSKEVEIKDGINSFLAEFNIENGIIQIEDEEGNPVEKPFNELSEQEKFNVLKSLSAKTAKSIEEEHDLSPSEIEVLNEARNSKVDIKDYIESLAQKRASDLSSLSSSNDEDFDSMEDDAIFMRFVKDSSPEATEEEIAEELSNAKNGKLFKSNVDRIRANYKNEQELQAQEEQAAIEQENAVKLEEERTMIVNSVVDIDKISDWPVTDTDKNKILGKMLELNEYGDPIFLEEVFSDPKEMFKAAWLYYNADNKFNEMSSYFKSEQTKAFNRGFDKASKGMSPEPISGSRSSNVKKEEVKKKTPGPIVTSLTLDDLDDD